MGFWHVEDHRKQTGKDRWIGHGVYTTAEASRLTGISSGRIRRWMEGYTFVRNGVVRTSPPVLSRSPDALPESEAMTISFRDLIEIMCVNGFLDAGARWPRRMTAYEKAADDL